MGYLFLPTILFVFLIIGTQWVGLLKDDYHNRITLSMI
jgi:hypothetical protein